MRLELMRKVKRGLLEEGLLQREPPGRASWLHTPMTCQ